MAEDRCSEVILQCSGGQGQGIVVASDQVLQHGTDRVNTYISILAGAKPLKMFW